MPTAKLVQELRKDFAKLKKEIGDFKRYTNNKIDDCIRHTNNEKLKKEIVDFKRYTNNKIDDCKRHTNNEIAAVKNDVERNSNKIHIFHNTTTVAIPTTTTTTATTAPERVILITGGSGVGGLLASTEVYPEIKTCSTPSLPKKTIGAALFMTAGTTPEVAYCGGQSNGKYLDS